MFVGLYIARYYRNNYIKRRRKIWEVGYYLEQEFLRVAHFLKFTLAGKIL